MLFFHLHWHNLENMGGGDIEGEFAPPPTPNLRPCSSSYLFFLLKVDKIARWRVSLLQLLKGFRWRFVMGIKTYSRSPNSSLINTVPVQPQLPMALKSSLIDLLTKFIMANIDCVT